MNQPLRFGPFEANLLAGELRRNGRLVKIQEQPFQVLSALLKHHGEVVTREQLRDLLWPGDSFGDFDQGLNTAINKLRDALGDSPANPKFIETLPKRGYRFLVPLEGEPVATPANGHRVPWVMMSLFFAGALAGALATWMLRPAAMPEVPVRRFTIRPPVPITARPFSPVAAISPDGRHIALVSGELDGSLWIHDLDQASARRISGSEGAHSPFWSPDSKTVGFLTKNALLKTSVNGGLPSRICEITHDAGSFYGAVWNPDGKSIVVALGNPSRLYVVPAAGGVPKPLLSEQMAAAAVKSTPDRRDGYFSKPHFLPEGSGPRLAYTLGYLNPSLVLQDLNSGSVEFLDRGSSPFYAAPGYIIYMRPGTNDLWARPISPSNGKAGAEAFRIAANGMHPSVSNDGTLVYVDSPLEQLAWFDRAGNPLGFVGGRAPGVFYPSISPDGRHVAVETLENANLDIWAFDVKRGSRVRLTTDLATDILPTWSPSGDEVAFSSYRSGSIDIWLRPADGGTQERLLFGTGLNERISDWSRDGQFILYSSLDPKSQYDIWYLSRGNDGKWQPHPYLQSPANEAAAKLSPDGRFVAYLSDESGRMELYVRNFPRGDRKWAISANGATQPRWSRDGKELFYAESGALIAVPVSTAPDFAPGPAARLFESPALTRLEREPSYDVSADRQRIVMPATVGGNEILIHVVQNWLAEHAAGTPR